MFCAKNLCKNVSHKKEVCDGAILLTGMMAGAVITTSFFLMKKIKDKKCSLKKAIKNCCAPLEEYNACECNEEHCDHERARNACGCPSEECDTEILHSHGCLGYPHDEYGGFADSKGDRPSDLSNPEIANQNVASASNDSPYLAKNAPGKSNPQPENKVNEVKKK